MEEKKTGPLTVDDYIAQFPEDVQKILVKIRAVIQEAAPGAEEKISYQMPGYHLNGGLVWFGAYKHHIGFYPITPAISDAFQAELTAYRGTKSAIHFPLDQPVPYDFIAKLVKVRVDENLKK
jgi:uncharacterized protein YdhG (YjbR/CyaY superfamily)